MDPKGSLQIILPAQLSAGGSQCNFRYENYIFYYILYSILRLRLGVANSYISNSMFTHSPTRYWPAGSQQAGAVHHGPGR